MCKLWKTVMKNRTKIFFEPDYMIRNGPVCQAGLFCQVATLAWLSCNYTKLIFVAFNQGAAISVSKRQTESARVKFSPERLKNGNDRLQRGNSLLWSLLVTGRLTQHALTGVRLFYWGKKVRRTVILKKTVREEESDLFSLRKTWKCR